MENWPPSELPCQLALESLSWECDQWDMTYFSELEADRLAAITTLTNLELRQTHLFGYVKALQSLPYLQRLALEGCANLGQHLLEPGAFASLEELHIENDYPTDRKGYPDLQRLHKQDKPDSLPPELRNSQCFEDPSKMIGEEDLERMRAAMKAKAVQCMSVVLQMPHIRKLSGNATLLKLGLPQPLPGWALSVDYSDRVWTKS